MMKLEKIKIGQVFKAYYSTPMDGDLYGHVLVKIDIDKYFCAARIGKEDEIIDMKSNYAYTTGQIEGSVTTGDFRIASIDLISEDKRKNIILKIFFV